MNDHVPDDDEYRVLRGYTGVHKNQENFFAPRWTQTMTVAFHRMVIFGWIEQDWGTTTTSAGKAAMQRHRRGGR